MKTILIILTILLPGMTFCVTRTVSLDGTQQYTSIQAAINACNNNDVILVYPGRYEENLDTDGHNITLASLYLNNPLQTYIDNTIIDGNLETCVRIVSGESVIINGLTFVNNEEHLNTYTNSIGGINVNNESNLSLFNSVIRDCTAIEAGGVLAATNSNLSLSNVQICNNKADRYGGGLTFWEANQLTFDSLHPSSIYNNIASRGMDIAIYYMFEENPVVFEIYLSLGSLTMTEPDNYYILAHNAQVNINIQQGFIAQLDSDLYVSPDGNDSNSGLSEETPFKTIAYAMQKIVSNLDNPHTIHLAAGTYSFTANGQLLPVGVKSHVRIRGTGTESTVIDGEEIRAYFEAMHIEDFEITGISMQNLFTEFCYPIGFLYCSEIKLQELHFSNTVGANISGIILLYCDTAVLENITVSGVLVAEDAASFKASACDNVYINQFITMNNTITDYNYNDLGFIIFDSDVVFRNSIFAGNTAQDAWLFAYQTIYPEYSEYNLDISNVLFINNTISNCDWVYCPIYMQNRFQRIQVNNCTIANNTGIGTLTKIFAYADVKNLISYNPGFGAEMYLRNHLTSVGIQADVTISNSLFRDNAVNSDLPALVTFTDNIMGGDPLFLGTTTDSLEVSQPEYYYLSADSPCIDTGVADTTGMNLPPMDLAGNYRVWNNRVDMGCYEYGSDPYVHNENPENPPLPEGITLTTFPNPVCLTGAKGAFAFIEFTLPEVPQEQPVIEIYNIKGQKIKTIRLSQSYSGVVRKAGLASQVKQSGEHYSTIWDCKNEQSQRIASGLYLVKVSSGRHQAVSKMMVIK